MEMEQHLDSPYGVWSKLEGKRSKLNHEQLSLLEKWNCGRNTDQIMKTLIDMVPEILRLNKYLSKQVNIEENECNLFQYMTAPNEKRAICDNCGEVSAEKQEWTLF